MEAPVVLSDVQAAAAAPLPTGIDELDRVLGGGLVPGSVSLLGGEPGIGKSTLLLQAMTALAQRGARPLLVCGEESPQQVRSRAARLGAVGAPVWLVAETCLQRVLTAVDDVGPDVLVVDSVQTLYDREVGSPPGSLAQVRGCAQVLVELSKRRGLTTVLVGHVTKEGALAGPRVLEHVVDTVLTFEGERHHALRLLRTTKNRFGPSGELGLFEMTERGLAAVTDPTGLFLAARHPGGDGHTSGEEAGEAEEAGAPGCAVFPAMEGHRPLVVELQALIVPCCSAVPRRSARGIDATRVSLLLAVLHRRAGLSLGASDVYVSAVGGARVAEPGADLALCLALASAAADRPLPPDMIACGEVGLAGEVRQVAQTSRRLNEAARLGFRRAMVPVGAGVPAAIEASGGTLTTVPVPTLADALSLTGVAPDRARSGRAGGRRGITTTRAAGGREAGGRAATPVHPPGPAGYDRPAGYDHPTGYDRPADRGEPAARRRIAVLRSLPDTAAAVAPRTDRMAK